MIRLMPLLLAAVLSVGACKKRPATTGPALQADEVVAQLRARAVPDPVNGRFSVKLKSKPLGITAPRLGGGIVVDRPDRAYIALLDPVGRNILTLSSDGDRAAFVNHHDKQFVAKDDIARALRDATDGSVTLAQITDMLLGLLPLADAQVQSRDTLEDGVVRFVFAGPGGIVIRTDVDPVTATPRRVEVDTPKGDLAVRATYTPFELVEAYRMPAVIDLEVPSVELTANVVFKAWKPLEEAPEVFSPEPAEGYEVIAFEDFVQGMGSAMGDKLDGDTPTDDTSSEDTSSEDTTRGDE